jgi:16S rRNA processing protein RimM
VSRSTSSIPTRTISRTKKTTWKARRPRPIDAAPRERLVAAGRLGAPFGVHGELALAPTRTGEDAIVEGARVALDRGDGELDWVRVASARRNRGRLIVRFDGVDTPESARSLTGRSAWLHASEARLREGEYLDADLIGLRLVDEAGRCAGTVSGVQHFPAQDCLVVQPGDALVPLVGAFIRDVDVAGGCIHVTLPAGLLDPSAAEEA